MDKLGQKVVEKIKECKICPEPKWRFLLKDYVMWTAFVISLIVGALAFCTLLHVFTTNDWYLHKYLHRGIIEHALLTFPYIWLVCLILFLGLAYYNYKHTKSGYRHEAYLVLALSVLGSLFLGTYLHTLGAGENIENLVIEAVPVYEKITCCRHNKDVWTQPDKGLLSGKILQIEDTRNFMIKDFKGGDWHIEEGNIDFSDINFDIEPGEEVKMIGERGDDHFFMAHDIYEWSTKKK